MRTRLYVLSSMLHELQDNHLEVVLLPQYHPTNPGACIRVAVGHNCEWYRQLCADFESRRKTHYKKFKTKDISKQIHSSRLSFASDDKMLEYLDITPGSVSVIGLINDTDCHVQLIVDEDILKEEYIGFHPCINTTSMKIKTKDLFEKVLPSIKHDYYIIQC